MGQKIANEKRIFYHLEEKTLYKHIEGPAKDSALVYKPEFPDISEIVKKRELNYVVELKFIISDSGHVVSVEPMVSSGYPQIDMECTRYLKQWKFAPRQTKEKVWGLVTLNITTG